MSDDGPGIARAERARVFDRFYRRPGTLPPGSGLGLAIVKAIAEAHGATVTLADGAGGRGLSVTVSLPASSSAQEARRRQQVRVAVGFLTEAVALVLGRQVPDLAAVGAHPPHQLLGLGGRHARVVLARHHQQRPLDARGVGERGDALEERAHLRVALVAVLGAAQVAPVGGGVAQEGHEVGDADDVDAAAAAARRR